VLVARIVVDVDGDAAQGGDFGGEGGEGVVVLSGEMCELGGCLRENLRDWVVFLTFRARMLRTWLWWL
jgi:hypothetical protein